MSSMKKLKSDVIGLKVCLRCARVMYDTEIFSAQQPMTSVKLYQRLKAFGPAPYRVIRFGKDNIRSFHASMSAETDTQAAKVANLTGVTTTSLQTTLTEKLGAQHVDVNDISGRPWILFLETC